MHACTVCVCVLCVCVCVCMLCMGVNRMFFNPLRHTRPSRTQRLLEMRDVHRGVHRVQERGGLLPRSRRPSWPLGLHKHDISRYMTGMALPQAHLRLMYRP